MTAPRLYVQSEDRPMTLLWVLVAVSVVQLIVMIVTCLSILILIDKTQRVSDAAVGIACSVDRIYCYR